MDRRSKILNLAGVGLIALALGTALTMILSNAFSLAASFGYVFLFSFMTAGLLVLGSWNRTCRGISLVIGAGILVITLFSSLGLFGKTAQDIHAASSGAAGGFIPKGYGALLCAALGVILTATMFWMTGMTGGVYPAVTLSMILILGCWYLSKQLQTPFVLMATGALAAMFAHASDEKISYLRAIPAAVIAAALAICIIPSGNATWQPLYDAAQKVRELFNDYFMFTDPRTTYSISIDGFQPRGELLGGPAKPVTADIMQVETDETVLLRGSVKRTYTTYSWTENSVNSRYVFIDPTRRNIRDNVFDSTRLDGLDIQKAFHSKDISVTMLNVGLSTLFVPHRLTDFSAPIDLVTYFSSSGEVFITRDVQPGDAYSVTALLPLEDIDAMRALLEKAAARGNDSGYQEAMSSYTALPQGIDQKVYQLAQTLTQGHSTPYDKALALQNHLLTHYTYSLDVDYPPQGEDFVSSFLLKSKTGYCSYFASAMAVMARMIGLPSRYVEGYLVPARESGTTIVAGKNAHAWVEIYFEGAGWIPFNPTPGSGDSYVPPSGDSENTGADSDQDDPQPTPAPTAKPPQNTPAPSPLTSDQPEEDFPDEPQSEFPEEDPIEEPEDNPPENESSRSLSWLWWLLAAIVAALAALWVILQLKKSDPAVLAIGRQSQAQKLAIWYRALLVLLEQQGQMPGPGETPEQFAGRLIQAGITTELFLMVAREISLNRYARQKVSSDALKQAREVYEQLRHQLKPLEYVRWLRQRVIYGLGSFKQIP